MKYKIYKVGLTGSTGVIGSVLNNRLKKNIKFLNLEGILETKKMFFNGLKNINLII